MDAEMEAELIAEDILVQEQQNFVMDKYVIHRDEPINFEIGKPQPIWLEVAEGTPYSFKAKFHTIEVNRTQTYVFRNVGRILSVYP